MVSRTTAHQTITFADANRSNTAMMRSKVRTHRSAQCRTVGLEPHGARTACCVRVARLMYLSLLRVPCCLTSERSSVNSELPGALFGCFPTCWSPSPRINSVLAP